MFHKHTIKSIKSNFVFNKRNFSNNILQGIEDEVRSTNFIGAVISPKLRNTPLMVIERLIVERPSQLFQR